MNLIIHCVIFRYLWEMLQLIPVKEWQIFLSTQVINVEGIYLMRGIYVRIKLQG